MNIHNLKKKTVNIIEYGKNKNIYYLYKCIFFTTVIVISSCLYKKTKLLVNYIIQITNVAHTNNKILL